MPRLLLLPLPLPLKLSPPSPSGVRHPGSPLRSPSPSSSSPTRRACASFSDSSQRRTYAMDVSGTRSSWKM